MAQVTLHSTRLVGDKRVPDQVVGSGNLNKENGTLKTGKTFRKGLLLSAKTPDTKSEVILEISGRPSIDCGKKLYPVKFV